VVNHIDNDKLNNHALNIQLITARYNTSKDRKSGSSIYTGVTWIKDRGKWHSRIKIGEDSVYLGSFIIEHDAHLTYQSALAIISLYDGDKLKFRALIKNKLNQA